jgi:hypothetical protein
VAYGRPVDYDADDTPGEVTDELIARVMALVDAAAAGYPDAPAGDDDRWWLPAHLGGTAPSVDEAEAMALREREERMARRRARRAGEATS